MSGDVLHLDHVEVRACTRWTLGASLGLHALLFLWVVHARVATSGLPVLAEVSLLESDDPGAGAPAVASPAPATAAPQTTRGALASDRTEARFRRRSEPADLSPDPQLDGALSDRLEARLATLQRDASVPGRGLAVAVNAAPRASASAGVAGGIGNGGDAPLALHRGGGFGSGSGGAPVLNLARGPDSNSIPDLALAGLTTRKPAEQAPARPGDVAARRTLAGASLAGPIADRAILSYESPVYPDWAKSEAVEASVTLYFVVLPDGSVKDNLLVQKTAGFEDFDASARDALRAWRFAPLRDGATGEQWGTITFRFRLRDAR